jgi:hypothetical protein
MRRVPATPFYVDANIALDVSMISAQTPSAFVARENRYALSRIMLKGGSGTAGAPSNTDGPCRALEIVV